MDSFIEKITQKFGSQDIIKANSEAEAEQLKAAEEKARELEDNIAEMRRLNLKCVETNELTNQLISTAIERIEEFRATTPEAVTANCDLQPVIDELESIRALMDESFKSQEDTIHKENVRVYRNVQASIVEELKQQSEALAIQHMHIERKISGAKPISILALVFSALSFLSIAALVALTYLGILKF